MRRILPLVLVPLAALVGCGGGDSYPSRPLTLVCPWAAGGGTDRVSRQMAMLLEQRLGQPVSVINATGGKGVTGHSRGLHARPDGYTLTMMTFELNTMHWAGLTDLTYQDCVPLVSVNEDYAALMVRSDASWEDLIQLESEVRESPGKLTASGTAIGGAWHLALAGWLVAADMNADDIVWVPSAGANPSLQQLISGGVDMVCCSLPEARTLLESGQIRALGLMAPERAKGFEDIPTFLEQGRDWSLGGWRGLGVPVGTPREVVDPLVQTLTEIVREPAAEGTFAGFMEAQKFDHTWRNPEEFRRFLAETDQKLGQLLTSDAMKSVSEDRFSPMTYPFILIAGIATMLIGLAVNRRRTGGAAQIDLADVVEGDRGVADRRGSITGALWVIVMVMLYALLAETIGFIPLASVILLLLLLRFGNRPIPSLLIVLLVVPGLYFVFANVLRVPLPRGWFG